MDVVHSWRLKAFECWGGKLLLTPLLICLHYCKVEDQFNRVLNFVTCLNMTVDLVSLYRHTGGLRWWVAVLFCLLGAPKLVLASQSVELSWTASPSPNIVAYQVYFGTRSGVYVNSAMFADVSDVLIPGLNSGQTYYFAVAAIDGNGNESPLSSEASYAVPGSTPITLQVQGSAAASQAVALSWTPSSEVDAYGYVVNYGTQSGVYTASATFYYTTNGVISGLTGGDTYYFAVSPIDSFGEEPVASDEVSYTVPNPPSLMLNAQESSDPPGVTLTWNSITNEGIDGYVVYYGTESGSYLGSFAYGPITNVVVQGLDGGQTYYFMVSSVDSYGNQSFSSSEASCVAGMPLPIALQVEDSTQALNSVEVSWSPSTDSEVYGYTIYYGTQSGSYNYSLMFYYTTNGLISGLTPGQTYYFALAPFDSFGLEGIASSEISYTVPAAQPIALGAQATNTPAGVELSWNAVTNAGIMAYYIYYGTQSGLYTDAASVGAVTNTLIQGLDAGEEYYFSVVAVDAYGNESLFSNEASAVAPSQSAIVLQTQTYTDGNGQPYLMEIDTPSAVYGSWEVDCSTDLQNWVPYSYGYGYGSGDGYDVDVYVSIDPTVPQMFFRAIQN
jgi:fibronectin type 3 domain-containing protein